MDPLPSLGEELLRPVLLGITTTTAGCQASHISGALCFPEIVCPPKFLAVEICRLGLSRLQSCSMIHGRDQHCHPSPMAGLTRKGSEVFRQNVNGPRSRLCGSGEAEPGELVEDDRKLQCIATYILVLTVKDAVVRLSASSAPCPCVRDRWEKVEQPYHLISRARSTPP